MPDNFIHTAERMRDTSDLLHLNGDYHNACYMAGYVVECYLKIFMSFSIPTLASNPRHYGHNINSLSTDLSYAVSSSTSTSAYRNYVMDLHIECNNIISSWNPNKRYEGNPSSWGEIMSNAFNIEKEKCFDMITKMMVDNLI